MIIHIDSGGFIPIHFLDFRFCFRGNSPVNYFVQLVKAWICYDIADIKIPTSLGTFKLRFYLNLVTLVFFNKMAQNGREAAGIEGREAVCKGGLDFSLDFVIALQREGFNYGESFHFVN